MLANSGKYRQVNALELDDLFRGLQQVKNTDQNCGPTCPRNV